MPWYIHMYIYVHMSMKHESLKQAKPLSQNKVSKKYQQKQPQASLVLRSRRKQLSLSTQKVTLLKYSIRCSPPRNVTNCKQLYFGLVIYRCVFLYQSL